MIVKRKKRISRKEFILDKIGSFLLALSNICPYICKNFLKETLICFTTMILIVIFLLKCDFQSYAVEYNLNETIVNEDVKSDNGDVQLSNDEMITEAIELIKEQPLIEPEINLIDTLSEEELFYFANIVEVEAEGCTFNGKLAVANIIYNRLNSGRFPTTYKEIATQRNNNGSYQFSSYIAPKWGKLEISEDTYKAINEALKGNTIVQGSLYFCNLEEVGKNSWFPKAEREGTLVRIATIDELTFYELAN